MKSPPPGHSYRLPMPLPPHRTHETRPPSSHEAGCDLHVAKTPNENEHDHSPLHIWHPVVGGVQETDDPDPLPDPETELSPDPALESFVPSPDPLRPTTVPPQAADRPKIRTSAPLRIARRSMNNPTSSIRHLFRREMVGEREGTVKPRRRAREPSAHPEAQHDPQRFDRPTKSPRRIKMSHADTATELLCPQRMSDDLSRGPQFRSCQSSLAMSWCLHSADRRHRMRVNFLARGKFSALRELRLSGVVAPSP